MGGSEAYEARKHGADSFGGEDIDTAAPLRASPPSSEVAHSLVMRTVKHMRDDLGVVVHHMPNDDQHTFHRLANDLRRWLIDVADKLEHRDDYRGWRIEHNPPPIPCRDFDWTATHPDFDGPEDSRQVWGRSWDAVRDEIDAWYEDETA